MALPTPSDLVIAQMRVNSGFYLLYLDQRGNELTDTYHESEADARSQAQFEFDLSDEDWIAEPS